MNRYILSIIMCLWCECAGAYTNEFIGAVASGGVVSSCPVGTYIFSWGGEWPSDVDKSCDNSADVAGVNGTITGSPVISVTEGEGGADVALTANAANEYLSWPSSGARIDINGAQTLWVRVYISATHTGDTRIFEALYDATNIIHVTIKADLQILGTHRIGGTAPNAYGAAIASGTWVDIAYTWDRQNQDHAVNSVGTWDEDVNELSSTDGSDITAIKVGAVVFSMGDGEYVKVTKFAIVSGYKAAKPW